MELETQSHFRGSRQTQQKHAPLPGVDEWAMIDSKSKERMKDGVAVEREEDIPQTSSPLFLMHVSTLSKSRVREEG